MLGVRRHEHQRTVRSPRAQPAGQLHAVHARHLDVQQHQVGMAVRHARQRLGCGASLAHDLGHRLRHFSEQPGEPQAGQPLVIDQQHPQRCGVRSRLRTHEHPPSAAICIGTSMRTTKRSRTTLAEKRSSMS